MKPISLILLLLSSITFAKTIHVNVDTPYSSGEFYVESIKWLNTGNFNGSLKHENDTIVFSNGTKITFINDYGMHCGAGGLCIIDSISTLAFKGIGEKELSFYEGNINKTENKIEENWHSVTSLPDSQFEADTFHIGSWPNEAKFQASYFYTMSGQDCGPAWFFLAKDSKCINYISTENTTIKLQLYDQNLCEGEEYEDGNIRDLRFRWAVDSVGNGTFNHVICDTVTLESHFNNAPFLLISDFAPDEVVDSIRIFEYPQQIDARVRYTNEGITLHTFKESNKAFETDSLVYRVSTNKKAYDVKTTVKIKMNESFAIDDTLELIILDYTLDEIEGVIINPHDTDYVGYITILDNDSANNLHNLDIISGPRHGYAQEENDDLIKYTLSADSILGVVENNIMIFDSLEYCVTDENGNMGNATLIFKALLDPVHIINTVQTNTMHDQNAVHKEILIYAMNGRVVTTLKNAKLSDLHTMRLATGSYIASLNLNGSIKRVKLLVK